ncbi:MAG TPA: transglutaminaseTgpA domain-containing protein [Ktedonobacterales bacterium]|jgi:transglutaminase-like putative cysteine protease
MQTTLQPSPKRAAIPAESEPPAAKNWWRRLPLRPEEGWSTLILLGFVIYSAVWSIQAVGWTIGLGILTWTTGTGLVLGLLAAKQHQVPRLLIHWVLVGAGIFFAFWETARGVPGGTLGGLWGHFTDWLHKAFTPNVDTNDDVMFLLFLAVLSFILAYVSAWLVFQARRPWLVAIATAIVLLINLAYTDGSKGLIYLVIFLLATLLLLVRSNLVEGYRQWRRRSLRYAPDMGWDFMLAGLIFSIAIMILSWFLPSGGVSSTVSDIWDGASNPWVSVQQFWNRLFQVSGGPGSVAYFGTQLQLTGNVDLPNITIMTYTSDVSNQYLVAITQDHFDGHTWSTGDQPQTLAANQHMNPESQLYNEIRQNIKVVNPPLGAPGQYFVFAAAQPASFSIPIRVTGNVGGYTSWYSHDPLVPGQHYTATSYVSTADEGHLRQVPLPDDSQDPLVRRYTQVPNDLLNDPRVSDLAHQIVSSSGATNMYDMAVALEDYLRGHYDYSAHNDQPPGNQDAVSWFLFHEKKGFCTFFASAMVMMARLLGMPARVASGYTAGNYDTKTNEFVVKGTDAHTWAQIYFGDYGWINFEPSASFNPVERPLPSVTATGSGTPQGGSVTPRPSKPPPDIDPGDTSTGSTNPNNAQADLGFRLLLGAGGTAAVLLLLLGSSSVWWQRRFRGLSPVAQTFGRVTLLASWAGFKPKRAQTPFEYIEELQQRLPVQAEPLQRLGELYVRERWGAPAQGTGIQEELRQLWMRLRGGLVRALMRRPSLNPLDWMRALASRRRRRSAV